jgi:hypothetical protein
MSSPEQIKEYQPPQEVQHIPEQIDVSERLAEQGVTAVPTQAQTVRDNSGQVIAQGIAPASPSQPAVTVTLPADQNQATVWSQGAPTDSSTWLGFYILRKFKQALSNGWKILIGAKK